MIGFLGSFEDDWRKDLKNYLVDEYKDAVDGIVDIRNTISHGRHVGVTIVRVKDYYARIKDVSITLRSFAHPKVYAILEVFNVNE